MTDKERIEELEKTPEQIWDEHLEEMKVLARKQVSTEILNEIDKLKLKLEDRENQIKLLKTSYEARVIELENKSDKHFKARIELCKKQNQKAVEALAEVERRLYESHYYKECENKYAVYMEEVQAVIDQLIKEYGGNNNAN